MLCLHGYMQSADILRHNMGSWRKGLRSRVEFHFVDAPIVVDDAPTNDPDLAARLEASKVEFRSWCAAKSECAFPKGVRAESQCGAIPGTMCW